MSALHIAIHLGGGGLLLAHYPPWQGVLPAWVTLLYFWFCHDAESVHTCQPHPETP